MFRQRKEKAQGLLYLSGFGLPPEGSCPQVQEGGGAGLVVNVACSTWRQHMCSVT